MNGERGGRLFLYLVPAAVCFAAGCAGGGAGPYPASPYVTNPWLFARASDRDHHRAHCRPLPDRPCPRPQGNPAAARATAPRPGR